MEKHRKAQKLQGKYVSKAAFFTGAILTAVIYAAALCSCSAGQNTIRDGYYSAEAAEFDVQGWKEYVTIYVSSGRIILVEYNAFNTAGFIRSWDMNNMRLMNAALGIYPNVYTRYYGGKLLANQSIRGIDALSGATNSYRQFLQLGEAVLKNAHQGNTETSFVDLTNSGRK